MRDTFETNVLSPLHIICAVIPHMAAHHCGLIVNVGSVVGERPTPWVGPYAASKATLHSFTETLKMECAPFGIQVSLIIPGSVASNIAAKGTALFSPQEGSLYVPKYLPAILKRVSVSQSGAMATDVFA